MSRKQREAPEVIGQDECRAEARALEIEQTQRWIGQWTRRIGTGCIFEAALGEPWQGLGHAPRELAEFASVSTRGWRRKADGGGTGGEQELRLRRAERRDHLGIERGGAHEATQAERLLRLRQAS